jgi:hypothetical protein
VYGEHDMVRFVVVADLSTVAYYVQKALQIANLDQFVLEILSGTNEFGS